MLYVTEKDFDRRKVQSVLPVTVMFYAPWCAKCSMMRPVIEDIEEQYKTQINFFEVNVDSSAALAQRYGASLVPFFVFFQNGKAVGAMQGVISKEVFQKRMRQIFRL